jgi:hypothetical protein
MGTMRKAGPCLLAIILGAAALAGCGRESADWKSASAADTTEAYQQFLQQHPASAQAQQAQARIKQLAEVRDWQTAASADTRAAYESFVAQHPDSQWAQEARIRIENFAQNAAAAPALNKSAAATPAVASGRAQRVARASTQAVSPRPAAATLPAATLPAAAQPASAQGQFVQLGAFRSKTRAQSEWKQLSAKFPAQLRSLKPRYVAGKSKAGHTYRLEVEVSSAASAKGLCATLKKHSLACVPVSA